MGDFSRDSFRATQNALVDLRGLLANPQPQPRHYVSIRLQQGVPLLDADWNEQEDIRRLELETLMARAIGSGVPAGNDGFRIREANPNSNNFFVEQGLILVDGWLIYNPSGVDYVNQPHRNAHGVEPPLPVPLDPSPIARRDLVYLDAWERPVASNEDPTLVDARIGIETALRVERAWVVRTAPLASVEALASRIREFEDHVAEMGRNEKLDVNFVPFGLRMNPTSTPDPDAFCEQVVRLAEIGVTWLSVGLPCPSRAGYCESAARFGEEIIAALGSDAG